MVEMPNFHGISDKIRGAICSFGVVLANHAKFNLHSNSTNFSSLWTSTLCTCAVVLLNTWTLSGHEAAVWTFLVPSHSINSYVSSEL